MKKEKWYKFQEWIAEYFKELDPNARCSKASGARGEAGDVTNSIGINCEAKCYNKKNVWDVDWLTKCEEEIPLHSNKLAIVVTENKDGQKHVHLKFEDFWKIYKEWYQAK